MKSVYTLTLMIILCLISSLANAQTRKITGTVLDNNNEPVIGATVLVDNNPNRGTITDVNGKFTIDVPESATALSISIIGMKTQRVMLGAASDYNVVLEDDTQFIDEVVVIGYGTVRKSDLTGSVASINADDIKGRITSIEQGLQGRVSGVMITQSEASPDGGLSMVVRGSNSLLGGTEPLYVVDGIPISGNNSIIRAGAFDNFGLDGELQSMTQGANMLSFLNPSDIESIEVLKDASATAIYGSRASNGVVLITTKKGKSGQVKISFDSSFDIANVYRKWDLLDAADFAEQENTKYLIRQIMRNDMTYAEAIKDLPYPGVYTGYYEYRWTPENNYGGDGSYRPSPEDYRNGTIPWTDWQDVIMRTGINQKYALSISGGNDRTKFYVGAGMDDIQGVLLGSQFKRYSINANLDSKLFSFMDFSNSTNLSHTLSDRAQVGNIQSGDMRGLTMAAVLHNPTSLISGFRYQMENGLLNRGQENPYTTATQMIDKNTVYTVMDNMALTINLAKGLMFKVSGGVRFNMNVRDYYIPTISNRYWNNMGGYATYGNSIDLFLINENLLFYNYKYDKHRLDMVAGFTQETTQGNTHTISTTGFLNDINLYYVLGSGETVYQPYSDYWKVASMSYLGRINYNFDERYLLTASIRADGSSRFGKSNKWGYFPSAAFAWRINQEGFLKDNNLISNLKLRLSYGETGNQGVAPYQSQAALTPGNHPYEGRMQQTYSYGSGMPNPDLKWETTKQYNSGLDLGFFKNRLMITGDFYVKKTVDLLQRLDTPSNSGFGYVYKNAGSLRNIGGELAITSLIIDKRDFNWNLTFNWSKNEIKVLDLGGIKSFPGYHVWGWANFPFPVTVGRSLGEIWGYKITHVMKTAEDVANAAKDSPVKSLGQYDFEKDEDGNMKRMVIGNTNPKFIFGLNSNIVYKNFDLSFAMAGSIGQDILNINADPGFDYQNRVHLYADNRWIPDVVDKDGVVVFKDNGKNGHILEPVTGGVNYGERTYSNEVENGSWIKMKNLTIGYMHKFKNPNLFISQIRPYISMNNVFCIDSYTGLDPETSIYGQNPLCRGVAFSEYPMTFAITFGINITF